MHEALREFLEDFAAGARAQFLQTLVLGGAGSKPALGAEFDETRRQVLVSRYKRRIEFLGKACGRQGLVELRVSQGRGIVGRTKHAPAIEGGGEIDRRQHKERDGK